MRDATARGHDWAVQYWVAFRGRARFAAGTLGGAEADFEQVVERARRSSAAQITLATAVLGLGRVILARRGGGEVGERIGAWESLLDHELPIVRRALGWLRALTWEDAGDPERAVACLRAGGSRPASGLPSLPRDLGDEARLVRLAVAAGDTRLADLAVREAAHRASRNPGVRAMAGMAAHARGVRTGDPDELRRALAALEGTHRPLVLAAAHEDLAQALTGAAGDRDEPILHLRLAESAYAAADASADAAKVRRALENLGATTLAPEPAGWSALTPGELRVVHLVADGMTNRAVADALFLSPSTVASHLHRAFGKLGVRTRGELVLHARSTAGQMTQPDGS